MKSFLQSQGSYFGSLPRSVSNYVFDKFFDHESRVNFALTSKWDSKWLLRYSFCEVLFPQLIAAMKQTSRIAKLQAYQKYYPKLQKGLDVLTGVLHEDRGRKVLWGPRFWYMIYAAQRHLVFYDEKLQENDAPENQKLIWNEIRPAVQAIADVWKTRAREIKDKNFVYR